MNLVSIQLALFFKHEQNRPDLIMYQINSELDSIFDTMPTMMDTPKDLPFDFPIVQVNSSDKVYGLKLSRKRVDLFIYPQKQNELGPVESFNSCKEVLNKYKNYIISNFDIVRVGLINTLFQEHNNNVEGMYEKFLKIPYSPAATELYLQFNEQQVVDNLRVNNVTTIKTCESNNRNGIMLQVDTNNIVDNSRTLSKSTIDCIVDIATKKLNWSLDLI